LRRQAWPRRNPVTSRVDMNQQETSKRLPHMKDSVKRDAPPLKNAEKPRINASELLFEAYDLHTGLIICL
jgi:hypothetical protein